MFDDQASVEVDLYGKGACLSTAHKEKGRYKIEIDNRSSYCTSFWARHDDVQADDDHQQQKMVLVVMVNVVLVHVTYDVWILRIYSDSTLCWYNRRKS